MFCQYYIKTRNIWIEFLDNVAWISREKQGNASKCFCTTEEILRNCSPPWYISECKIREGNIIAINVYRKCINQLGLNPYWQNLFESLNHFFLHIFEININSVSIFSWNIWSNYLNVIEDLTFEKFAHYTCIQSFWYRHVPE